MNLANLSPEDKKLYGAAFRMLRAVQTLSVSGLSSRADVSFSSIYQLEAGTISPNSNIPYRILSALHNSDLEHHRVFEALKAVRDEEEFSGNVITEPDSVMEQHGLRIAVSFGIRACSSVYRRNKNSSYVAGEVERGRCELDSEGFRTYCSALQVNPMARYFLYHTLQNLNS